jgi:cytochrome bd-type quinol oxidase subunit 2
MFNYRPIPYVIYYWHLERLLTTFPLFHFYLFSDYTLPLHLFLFILCYKILKFVFIEYSKLETKYDWRLLFMYSFSFSLLALIYILMIWVFLQCIIIPTITHFISDII